MRGKVNVGIICDWVKRITPAYAGKSVACCRKCDQFEDHPRLCGEKAKRSSILSTSEGSPPPMRGKAPCRTVLPDAIGITPAYAGKRVDLLSCSNRQKDHPRLCGEKSVNLHNFIFHKGSPPPMRGKASKQLKPFLKDRITPAYAGKSNSSDTLSNMN